MAASSGDAPMKKKNGTGLRRRAAGAPGTASALDRRAIALQRRGLAHVGAAEGSAQELAGRDAREKAHPRVLARALFSAGLFAFVTAVAVLPAVPKIPDAVRPHERPRAYAARAGERTGMLPDATRPAPAPAPAAAAPADSASPDEDEVFSALLAFGSVAPTAGLAERAAKAPGAVAKTSFRAVPAGGGEASRGRSALGALRRTSVTVREEEAKAVVPKLVVIAQPPRPTFQPRPPYPKAAKDRETEGTVSAAVLVSAAGTPARVEIFASAPTGVFEDSVKQTLAQWRFIPARDEDGKSVECWRKFQFSFQLQR